MPLQVGNQNVTVTGVALERGGDKEWLAISVADAAGNAGAWFGNFTTDKAVKVTARTLAGLGWDPIARDWAFPEILKTNLLVGVKAFAVVVDEEYQGTMRRKVKWLNGPHSRAGMEMDPAQVLDLAARLRARLRNTGLAGPTSPPSSAPASDDDDCIPF